MPTLGRRRALGQHFLKDTAIAQSIAEKIVQEGLRHSCSTLLEIGPGKGAITLPILELLKVRQAQDNFKEFLLVERDVHLAEKWKEHSSDFKLRVETADFLEIPEDLWLGNTPVAIVSNLPYSAGTAILNRLAEQAEKIPVMVLMFQAEVAKRIRAEPSTKERGSLSLWIQNQWDVEKLLFVPPSAFAPPPEVDSEVVVLTRRKEPRIPFSTEPNSLWEPLLRTCFAQRRQMLRKVLRTFAPCRNALELAGVDGTKRAEALQWEEWNSLFQAVRKFSRLPAP